MITDSLRNLFKSWPAVIRIYDGNSSLSSSDNHARRLNVEFTLSILFVSFFLPALKCLSFPDYPVEIQVENFNENDWIIVNANRTGYYRVIYDEENRNRLLAQLEEDHEVFSPATRASLIDDSFSLAMAGYLNYSDVFQFTKYMSKERHYLPWRVLLSNFKYVTQMLHTTSAYGLFQVRCSRFRYKRWEYIQLHSHTSLLWNPS